MGSKNRHRHIYHLATPPPVKINPRFTSREAYEAHRQSVLAEASAWDERESDRHQYQQHNHYNDPHHTNRNRPASAHHSYHDHYSQPPPPLHHHHHYADSQPLPHHPQCPHSQPQYQQHYEHTKINDGPQNSSSPEPRQYQQQRHAQYEQQRPRDNAAVSPPSPIASRPLASSSSSQAPQPQPSSSPSPSLSPSLSLSPSPSPSASPSPAIPVAVPVTAESEPAATAVGAIKVPSTRRFFATRPSRNPITGAKDNDRWAAAPASASSRATKFTHFDSESVPYSNPFNKVSQYRSQYTPYDSAERAAYSHSRYQPLPSSTQSSAQPSTQPPSSSSLARPISAGAIGGQDLLESKEVGYKRAMESHRASLFYKSRSTSSDLMNSLISQSTPIVDVGDDQDSISNKSKNRNAQTHACGDGEGSMGYRTGASHGRTSRKNTDQDPILQRAGTVPVNTKRQGKRSGDPSKNAHITHQNPIVSRTWGVSYSAANGGDHTDSGDHPTYESDATRDASSNQYRFQRQIHPEAFYKFYHRSHNPIIDLEPEAAHSALVKGANGRRVYDKHLASSYDIVEGEGHHAFKPTPVASPGTANSDSDERGDSKRSGNRGSDTADLSNKQFVRKSQQYVAADKAYYDYVNKSATAGAPSYYTLAIQATANASKDGGADSGGASLSSAVLPSGASRGRSHTDLMRGTSVELPAAVSRKKAMPYYDPSSAGGTTARINNSRMSTHKKHFQGAVVSEKKETNQMRAWGCFSEKIRPGHDPILHRGGDEASEFVNNIRDKVGFGSGPRSNTAYDMQTVDNDYRYDNAQPYDEYAGERSGVRRTGRRRVGMADRYDPKDPYNTMQHRNEHLQELERNTQESYDFYSGGHSSSTSGSSDGQRLRGGEREGKEKQLHDRADRESQPITADTRTYGHRRQPSRRHRSSYAPDTPEHSRPQRRLDQEKRNRGHLQGILGSTTHHQRTNSAFNVQDLVDTDTHALSQSAEPADQLQDHGIDLSIPAIRRLPTDSNLRKPSVRFIGHHYKSNPVFAYSDSGGICPPGDRLSDGREEKAAHEKNIEEYFSHHEKKRTFYKPLFKQHKDTRLW